MKPEELEVGKTYIGKKGKPRTITEIGVHFLAYTIGDGEAIHWWGIHTFANWAEEVQR